MEVIEVEGEIAKVDSRGMKKEVRLDIVDRIPKVGDFVIVHAGFAIHTMEKEEAKRSLELFYEMAKYV
ncbi:HypC/HybG/HupF family hydrogenase formation chaperone [Dissulfuribacter thermophilus]|nr:HypC/HybG/HupF family hydrogenase formation chaperone [Dissulfuribacter thermophilus]